MTPQGLSDYQGLPLEEATRKIEIHLITRALEKAEYVQSRTAETLGSTRRILKYKIDQKLTSINALPKNNPAPSHLCV